MRWPGPQCCRYARYGAAFGLVFPVIATLVTGWTHHTGFTPAAILAMHLGDPLLLIIDSAPFWLGLFACFAGARTDVLDETLARLAETNEHLEALNAEILVQLKEQNERLEAQNEDLVRLGEVKDLFLANMSHEIRTPLTSLLGFAEMLLESGLSAERREGYVGTILRNGEHLLAVLDDILDISKIEAGMLAVERIPSSPIELLQDVDALLGPRARDKGLAFVTKLETPVPREIQTDPVRLRQILLNLASNAVKFTHQGRVRLTVSADDDLVFAFTDTGIGIPSDRMAGLFEKFVQADSSTTRRFGGTGLGLAISRELVERMGGTLRMDSIEGEGSTFVVRLPFPRVSGPVTLAAKPGSARDDVSTLRILAAEDNLTNQFILRALLEPAGVSLRTVANGAEAVDAFGRDDFDLILMDVQMPVMNGVEATRAIREHEAAGRRAPTPILALSANVMSHQVREYAEAGMDGVVAKPVDAGKLIAAIAQAMERGAA